MAKKAKFRVRGYFKDLMGWFKLMKRREEWIAAGDPNNIDLSDNPAALAKISRCGVASGHNDLSSLHFLYQIISSVYVQL